MKPILTPCSFSNFSWKRLRISITGAMFTSLNVVRIALVAWDCSSRSATRARKRDIGTRCSGRSARFMLTGGATAGSAAGCPVGAGALVAGAGRAAATSTSPFVMRPSLPVPVTEPGAMPWSAISFAAAGIATPPLADAGAAAGAEAAGAATGAGAGAAAPALASVSMRAIS